MGGKAAQRRTPQAPSPRRSGFTGTSRACPPLHSVCRVSAGPADDPFSTAISFQGATMNERRPASSLPMLVCCPHCKAKVWSDDGGGVIVRCSNCRGPFRMPGNPISRNPANRKAILKLSLKAAEAEFAQWRVWAADVRDRRGPYSSVPPAVSQNAALLAQLLDFWQEQHRWASRPGSPGNLMEPLENAIVRLVESLIHAGTAPPPGCK